MSLHIHRDFKRYLNSHCAPYTLMLKIDNIDPGVLAFMVRGFAHKMTLEDIYR